MDDLAEVVKDTGIMLLDHPSDPDITAERLILGRIRALRPHAKVISEESAKKLSDYSGEVIIVDPLDGTRQYLEGLNDWSVNIGQMINGEVVSGVIYSPSHDALYLAERGCGAFLKKGEESRRLRVSDIDRLSQSRMVTRRLTDKPLQFVLDGLNVRERIPLSSYGIVSLIATGKAELYVHNTRSHGKWDSCATHAILSESGGRMSNFQGGELDYTQGSPYWEQGLVASNSHVHEEVICAIQALL